MNKNKLRKTKEKLANFRKQGGIKSTELESFAQDLGRKRSPRGSEPTWVSVPFPDLRPLSIPHHSSDLNKFTAGSILDQLEEDIERWERHLESIKE